MRSLLVAFALGFYLLLAPVAYVAAILICAILLLFSLQPDLQSGYIYVMILIAMNGPNNGGRPRIFSLLLTQVLPYIVIFGLPPILNLKVMTDGPFV